MISMLLKFKSEQLSEFYNFSAAKRKGERA